MKLAYLVLAHKDLEHLPVLINNLSNPNIDFLIHIDRKAKFNEKDLLSAITLSKNVFVLKHRFSITWGGFSMFKAVFSLIAHAIHKGKYDYLSLISGQDFPLQNPKSILSYLTKMRGKEFINYHSIPFAGWPGNGGIDRFNFYWLIDELGWEASEKFVEKQNSLNTHRQLPFGLQPFGGSMWFTLTGECCKYIYSYLTTQRNVLDFFQYTLISDELIIPTIVLNSSYRTSVVNDNLRLIEWSENRMHPKTFTAEDWNILSTSNCHLARKFDYQSSHSLIERLSTKLLTDR